MYVRLDTRGSQCSLLILFNTFFSPHQQSVLQGTTFRPGCPSHFQVSGRNVVPCNTDCWCGEKKVLKTVQVSSGTKIGAEWRKNQKVETLESWIGSLRSLPREPGWWPRTQILWDKPCALQDEKHKIKTSPEVPSCSCRARSHDIWATISAAGAGVASFAKLRHTWSTSEVASFCFAIDECTLSLVRVEAAPQSGLGWYVRALFQSKTWTRERKASVATVDIYVRSTSTSTSPALYRLRSESRYREITKKIITDRFLTRGSRSWCVHWVSASRRERWGPPFGCHTSVMLRFFWLRYPFSVSGKSTLMLNLIIMLKTYVHMHSS